LAKSTLAELMPNGHLVGRSKAQVLLPIVWLVEIFASLKARRSQLRSRLG